MPVLPTCCRRAVLAALTLVLSCGYPERPEESGPIPITGEPIVVLVAIDGFRADWVNRTPAATLRELTRVGVSADGMTPVFPTVTFPNGYSIATGLYPSHHGIIANRFFDPALGEFDFRDPAANQDPRWWGGEPIWVTAERQGRRAATLFWVGSEVPHDGQRASDWLAYDRAMPVAARVDTVLKWLGRPAETRPRLVTMYFHQVDQAAHNFGTASAEVDRAIGVVDAALSAIWRGVDSLGLRGQVNVVIVSDHGMVDTSLDRVIHLDSLIALDQVRLAASQAVALVYPTATGPTAASLVEMLRRHPRLTVTGPGARPAHWHLDETPRVAPVIAVAEEGWSIVTTEQVAAHYSGGPRLEAATHGYDNELPAMKALFIAAGPAFERGRTIRGVSAVDVYSLLAALLEITPASNDGSLEPFRPGLRR